jgi:PEP-CTERM motif
MTDQFLGAFRLLPGTVPIIVGSVARSRQYKPPPPVLKLTLIALLAIFATPSTSRGALIVAKLGPNSAPIARLSCSILPGTALGNWLCYIDPLNVEAFQLDFQFDPSQFSYTGITYVSPYAQTAPPDLSQLSSGLIQNIAGASSISPPPPGDVNIFAVELSSTTLSTAPPVFTAFASGTNFITSFDTSTGLTTTIGASQIMGCSSVPEPSSLTLLSLGALGLLGCGWRRLPASQRAER